MNRSAWSEARVRGTWTTPPLRRALALLALLAIWLIAAPAHALPSYLAANLAYVRETRHLDASGAAQASGDLDSLHADATWTYKQTWVFGAGLFNTTGSSDANLYAPNRSTAATRASRTAMAIWSSSNTSPSASWIRPSGRG